jgi:hypothetical protein
VNTLGYIHVLYVYANNDRSIIIVLNGNGLYVYNVDNSNLCMYKYVI